VVAPTMNSAASITKRLSAAPITTSGSVPPPSKGS
jgi:hypothetical protein